MKMIKVEKDKLLLSPKNFKPSSNKFEVLGVLNPAAAKLPNGKIILYVRVIEQLKKTEDSRYFYAPRFIGKGNKFKIKIDKFTKSKVVGQDRTAIIFKNNTKRLTFISHLRRVYLDRNGLNIIKIEKKPTYTKLP